MDFTAEIELTGESFKFGAKPGFRFIWNRDRMVFCFERKMRHASVAMPIAGSIETPTYEDAQQVARTFILQREAAAGPPPTPDVDPSNPLGLEMSGG